VDIVDLDQTSGRLEQSIVGYIDCVRSLSRNRNIVHNELQMD